MALTPEKIQEFQSKYGSPKTTMAPDLNSKDALNRIQTPEQKINYLRKSYQDFSGTESGLKKFADVISAPFEKVAEYTTKPIVETLAKIPGETVASGYELAGKQAPAWAAKTRLASPQLLAAMGDKQAAARSASLGGKGAGFVDVLNIASLLPGEGLVAKGVEEANLLSKAGKASKFAAMKEGALTGGKWGAAYGAASAADQDQGLGGITKGAVTGGLTGAGIGLGLGAAGLGLQKGLQKKAEMGQQQYENAIKQILQGSPEDYEKGKRALSMIDFSNIHTYEDLENQLNNQVKNFSDVRTQALGTDKTHIPLQYLGTEAKSGNKTVYTNHVENALDQLLKQYQATGDIYNEARILDLFDKAKTKGLTLNEIEDLSVEHGRKLNAYNAQGELASGLKKQNAENTRAGLKQTVDDRFNHPVNKVVRSALSDLIRTRDLVSEMKDKVYAMQNRLKTGGLGEKLAGVVSKIFNIASLGQGKGFVRGIAKEVLPGMQGSTTLNAVELEKALRKNLKIIDKIGQKGQTEQEIRSMLNEVIKNQSDVVGLLESPKSKKDNSGLLSQEEAKKRISTVTPEMQTMRPGQLALPSAKEDINYDVNQGRPIVTSSPTTFEPRATKVGQTDTNVSNANLQSAIDKAQNKINKRIESFRKQAGLMASNERAGVRSRAVKDAVGNVNFMSNDFSLNRAKSDMAKRANDLKAHAHSLLYENDPEFRSEVDSLDQMMEKRALQMNNVKDIDETMRLIDIDIKRIRNAAESL